MRRHRGRAWAGAAGAGAAGAVALGLLLAGVGGIGCKPNLTKGSGSGSASAASGGSGTGTSAGAGVASGTGVASGASAGAGTGTGTGTGVTVAAKGPLKVSGISFAGPAGHREDATFARGESVICLLTVTGFSYKNGKAALRTAVQVKDKVGRLVLDVPSLDLLKGKAPTNKPGEVRGAAKLKLSPALPPGKYTVTLTATDALAKRTSKPATGAFDLVGALVRREGRLTIKPLRLVGDAKVPAGSVVPLAMRVRGMKARRSGKWHTVDVGVETRLFAVAGNKAIGEPQRQTLLRRTLLFAPASHPAEVGAVLPANLAAGKYRIVVTATDRVGKQRAKATQTIEIVPVKLGVYNPHLHDASHNSRVRFRFGEQTFIRFSVMGFAVRDGQASFAVDVAISGKTEGGVYLARKNAVTLAKSAGKAAARRGRFAAQLPIVMPKIAPQGRYRLLLRVRDLYAKKSASRLVDFGLRGKAPKRLGTFRIDRVELRLRPDLPALEGDTIVGGKAYHLTLVAGGGRLKKIAKLTYHAKLHAHLRLRNIRGQVVHVSKNAFRFDRRFHYIPLRIPIAAVWRAPRGLRAGLYDLQIEALSDLDNRASQLSRRVAYLPAR